ncbi:MAG: quinone-dependent dihydroorotate dehydrogenase [Flavobacteriaceae bacterium]|nr:quinone-dependent dihydroorotate dehydrogenase [Flavobacteriaceae bacterium]
MYQNFIRPLLFMFDPEMVHHVTFRLIKLAHRLGCSLLFRKLYRINDPSLHRQVFGIDFPNPVGLAAGFDKDAQLYHELANFGFGFIEIGTVTPKPQDGNPKKRLFRLKEDQGIINRMGFNNRGVENAVKALRKNNGVVIGGNIGKNKTTPNARAAEDYRQCFEALFPYVDYFVVNVSSPNTPDLRALQDKEPLTALLNDLQVVNNQKSTPKPILLKIAPDLTHGQLKDIIEIVALTKIDGVIATNTTIARDGLISGNKNEAGGLSGRPLRERSTEVIRFLHQESKGAFPIVGVGGINSAQDALDKIDAGASLVQIYTGFVYGGPALIRDINKALVEKTVKNP